MTGLVRNNFQRIKSVLYGPDATPTFAGVTLSGLTSNALLYSVSGVLTSLGVATNGQLPIGSTGAAPVLAGITGTANQVVSTPGAGSITLSTPQDIHSAASNFTVAGATVTGASVLGLNSAVFQPAAGGNSATFFQVKDADGGTPILNVDTVGEKVGIGNSNAQELLVVGDNLGSFGAVKALVIGNTSGTSGFYLGQGISNNMGWYWQAHGTPALAQAHV
ncbi:hypothetical protein LCGC14_3107840, partial [marine sediment metagenome]